MWRPAIGNVGSSIMKSQNYRISHFIVHETNKCIFILRRYLYYTYIICGEIPGVRISCSGDRSYRQSISQIFPAGEGWITCVLLSTYLYIPVRSFIRRRQVA